MPRRWSLCQLKRKLPGPWRKTAFPGALGQRIFEDIFQAAYDMWAPPKAHRLSVNRQLNLGDPQARNSELRQEMEKFFRRLNSREYAGESRSGSTPRLLRKHFSANCQDWRSAFPRTARSAHVTEADDSTKVQAVDRCGEEQRQCVIDPKHYI